MMGSRMQEKNAGDSVVAKTAIVFGVVQQECVVEKAQTGSKGDVMGWSAAPIGINAPRNQILVRYYL